jgi:hypothetical protein
VRGGVRSFSVPLSNKYDFEIYFILLCPIFESVSFSMTPQFFAHLVKKDSFEV